MLEHDLVTTMHFPLPGAQPSSAQHGGWPHSPPALCAWPGQSPASSPGQQSACAIPQEFQMADLD